MKLLNVAGGFYVGVALGICAFTGYIIWNGIKHGEQ